MCENLNVSVIIPSLNPDEKLIPLVQSLTEHGFDSIIIVDDGSDEKHKAYFPDPEKLPQCTLLRHEINRGKGAALKTAFAYFLQNLSDRDGVVTADGDAQHRPEDIYNCAKKMAGQNDKIILGVRDFSLPEVPKKSLRGNRITAFVFRFGCGLKISDTQTGLRAIPSKYLPTFLKTEGERYEYETNQLLEFKTYNIPFLEERIQTVYINENKTSHFRAFHDSVRIYRLILKFMLSSITASLIDIGCFYIFLKFLGSVFGGYAEAVCTVFARIISSAANFFINKRAVFKNDSKITRTVIRYYSLAIPQMLVSAGSLTLVTTLLGNSNPGIATLIKIIIDIILFFISYRIQEQWVFKRQLPDQPADSEKQK